MKTSGLKLGQATKAKYEHETQRGYRSDRDPYPRRQEAGKPPGCFAAFNEEVQKLRRSERLRPPVYEFDRGQRR